MSIKKHIPNSITCCNLICGCIATCFAFGGQPAMALLFIILGAVFDFFDGMTARLLGVSSPIGKELDSLADDVTFGVAPSTMIFYELTVMDYPTLLEPLRPIFPYVAFIMAAFSALRLAKFNLDERLFISSWLLVSEIPMFALKFKHWGWAENKLKYIFLITSALLLLIFRIPGIALVIAWYVLLSAFTQQQANPKIEG